MKEEMETEKAQREAEFLQQREEASKELTDGFTGLNAGLEALQNLMNEQKQCCEEKKALNEQRWAEKEKRWSKKDGDRDEMFVLLKRIDEMVNECREEQKAAKEEAAGKPGHRVFLAQSRPGTFHEELVRLDTFAVPHVVAQLHLLVLGSVSSAHRVRNITCAGDVTGKSSDRQIINSLLAGRYSQVHERHPQHAFYVVPDKDPRTLCEPDYFSSAPHDPSDEKFMKHPGVKCAHCLLDIVGARFHCAICDSVDICYNCESAGLPGNLDSADGGHNSSHILIKASNSFGDTRFAWLNLSRFHFPWKRTRYKQQAGELYIYGRGETPSMQYTQVLLQRLALSRRGIHHAFASAARSNPLQKAVIDHLGNSISYADLDYLSSLLASYLRAHDVRPGSLVALVAQRSIAQVVAILGILRAGVAYIPLDGDITRDDTPQSIMLDAKPTFVLVS
ncbi:hypothetical protein EDD18DRAFT_1362753 [Armillaria luteobubalina]|uniref:ZZ-type domain-containing protein n=1 Tax=Armillaria luteobubalina TaxID=153913 RepID=A0AA39UK43_9AGAR|nr:hypothetical protein EDD18DRAFT_1362753 [Armillaria luteobubalina]